MRQPGDYSEPRQCPHFENIPFNPFRLCPGHPGPRISCPNGPEHISRADAGLFLRKRALPCWGAHPQDRRMVDGLRGETCGLQGLHSCVESSQWGTEQGWGELGLGRRGRASVCAHVPDLASSTPTQTLRLSGHHLLSKRDYVPRVASLSELHLHRTWNPLAPFRTEKP